MLTERSSALIYIDQRNIERLQLLCGEWVIEGLERKVEDRELLYSLDKRWWYLGVG